MIRSRVPLRIAAMAMVFLSTSALAQYKVVAPDGRVTYTDRPPVDASLKILDLGRRSPAADAAARPALPIELRQLSERFPVTLFTATECAPCEAGRQLLQERGVPYSERSIVSNDDIAALERLVGGRTLPALTVGGQALRGYAASDWTSYLDAAGYPRESRLPRDWTPPAPTPLVARAAPAPRPTVPAAPTPEVPSAAPPAIAGSGPSIRF